MTQLIAMPEAVHLTISDPGRDDVFGIRVWGSTTNGFTADGTTLLYSGQGLALTIPGLTAGTPFYVRYAILSELDPEDYDVSGQLTATPQSLSGAFTALRLSASSYVFRKSRTGVVTPAAITLTALKTGTTGAVTWTCPVTLYTAPTGGSATTTGDVVYLRKADFGSNEQIEITAAIGALTDTATVSLVDAGSDALLVVLTNPSHPLPTTTGGAVTYTNSGTQVRVYEGGTLLTITAASATGNNITAGAVSGTGTTVVTVAAHSAASADSCRVDLSLTVTRQNGASATIDAAQAVYKAWQGATGNTGSTGSTGATGNRGAGQFYATAPSAAWSNSAAQGQVTAVTGSAVLFVGDTVTETYGGTWAETRTWSGSAWITTGQVIDGNLVVTGTLAASKLTGGAITATTVIDVGTPGTANGGLRINGGGSNGQDYIAYQISGADVVRMGWLADGTPGVRVEKSTGGIVRMRAGTLSNDHGQVEVWDKFYTSRWLTARIGGHDPIAALFNKASVFASNGDCTYIRQINTDNPLVLEGGAPLRCGDPGSSNYIDVKAPDLIANYTLTLPAATDTLVVMAGAMTLTNKTMGSGCVWNGGTVPTAYGGTGGNFGTGTGFLRLTNGDPAMVDKVSAAQGGTGANLSSGTGVIKLTNGVATLEAQATGTVTSVATSGAITGGTITGSGTISHSTADGYLHVPATSTTNNGKVLMAGATAGALSWATLTGASVGLGSVENTALSTWTGSNNLNKLNVNGTFSNGATWVVSAASGSLQFNYAGFVLTSGSVNSNVTNKTFGASGGNSWQDVISTAAVITYTYATTGTGTATVINASNQLVKSSSSQRYKRDIEDLDVTYADHLLDTARPVWYRSNPDTCCDPAEWSWFGLIAEEVAEIEPRLVSWSRPTKEVTIETDEGPRAETVTDMDAPLRPEGVMYDRIAAMLLPIVKRQRAQIADLEARLSALERGSA